jgi:hypothetical protein
MHVTPLRPPAQVYIAARGAGQVRVYELWYSDSMEQHRFQAAVAREQRAFEELIRAKGAMVLPDLGQVRPSMYNIYPKRPAWRAHTRRAHTNTVCRLEACISTHMPRVEGNDGCEISRSLQTFDEGFLPWLCRFRYTSCTSEQGSGAAAQLSRASLVLEQGAREEQPRTGLPALHAVSP